MLESFMLGGAQGLCEWLPYNSQACVIELKTRLFPSAVRLNELLATGAILHIGTLAAGGIYFRREIPRMLPFLGISTLLAAVALWIMPWLNLPAQTAALLRTAGHSLAVAVFITTGIYSLRTPPGHEKQLSTADSIPCGSAQALSLLPGLSRAAFNMAALALQGFSATAIVRMGVLISLPLGILELFSGNARAWTQLTSQWPGILAAFIFGTLALHLLMLLAQRAGKGYFLLAVAGLLLAGIFTGIAG